MCIFDWLSIRRCFRASFALAALLERLNFFDRLRRLDLLRFFERLRRPDLLRFFERLHRPDLLRFFRWLRRLNLLRFFERLHERRNLALFLSLFLLFSFFLCERDCERLCVCDWRRFVFYR